MAFDPFAFQLWLLHHSFPDVIMTMMSQSFSNILFFLDVRLFSRDHYYFIVVVVGHSWGPDRTLCSVQSMVLCCGAARRPHIRRCLVVPVSAKPTHPAMKHRVQARRWMLLSSRCWSIPLRQCVFFWKAFSLLPADGTSENYRSKQGKFCSMTSAVCLVRKLVTTHCRTFSECNPF